MIIYKITNLINNKIYIGLTTVSLEERWRGHKTSARIGINRHLYNSMRLYGINNFKIEEIDKANSIKELGEKERYYIELYNTRDPNVGYNMTAGGERNQYDGNPRAKLTVNEVIQIREIYSLGEISCKECWLIYKDKISFEAFQKIWEGSTWKGILDDVYTEENLLRQKKLGAMASIGEKNPNASSTNAEVLEIRKYYSDHTLKETFEKFGKKYKSKISFRNVVEKGYKNIPKYSKTKKKWFLNGTEIKNIEDYNPVSTILVSEE